MSKWNVIASIRTYNVAVWVRFIGTMLTSLTGFMLRPFLVFYLFDQLGGQVMLSMLIVGLQPLCGILVSVLGGRLSDKYGRKPIMLISLFVQVLSMIGYSMASGVWAYALLSVLNGLGSALFMPAANAQVSDVVPEEKRAQVFALLHTGLNLGAAFGPLIGLAMFTWNPKMVFLCSAASLAVYALLLVWKVPETLPAQAQAGQVTNSNSKTTGPAKIKLREHKSLFLFSLFAMPITLLYSQVDTTLPLHLVNHFENGKSVFATLVTVNGFLVIFLQMLIAKLSENKKPALVIGASYLLFALVAFGYGYVSIFVLLLAVEFVFTIGEMLSGPHMQKIVSIMAPQQHRGFYFSVYGISWQLARGLGPMIGGALFQWVGGSFVFTVVAVLILAGGLSQQIIIRSLDKRARERESVVTVSA